MSLRPSRKVPLLAGLVLVAAGCTSEPRLDDVELDLSKEAELEQAFEEPRRYPFTVAVAPLYIEWTEAGREQVVSETLASPIPLDDFSRKQFAGWPGGLNAAEEEAIIRVLRERFAVALEEGAAPITTGVPVVAEPAAGGEATGEGEGEEPEPAGEGEGVEPEPAGEGEGVEPAGEGEGVEPAGEGEGVEPASEGEDVEPGQGAAPVPPLTPEGEEGEEATEPVRKPRRVGGMPKPKPVRKPRRVAAAGGRSDGGRLLGPPEDEEGEDEDEDEAEEGGDADEQADTGEETAPGLGAADYTLPGDPADWEPLELPEDLPGEVIRAHRNVTEGSEASGTTVSLIRLERGLITPRGEVVRRNRTSLAGLRDQLTAEPGVTRLADLNWSLVGGHPAADVRLILSDGRISYRYYVVTKESTFAFDVSGAVEGLETVHKPLRQSLEVVAEKAELGVDPEVLSEQEKARGAEIDAFEGKNFPISEVGFRDRMAQLLDQFGVFERVERLKFVSDAQRSDPLALVGSADEAGADLLLVPRLRRNKISYQGIDGTGFLLDFVSWLTLWWPSAIWPGVDSEDYRSDVELLVEIYDVRSGAVLWATTYTADATMTLSTPDRGWIPWGIIWSRFGLLTDSMLTNAGRSVRPRTWLSVEQDLVSDLWEPDGFKAVIDANNFEDRINQNVAPRRLGLVAGVSTYGARAEQKLAEIGGGADGESGGRPFAEADAQALGEALTTELGFVPGFTRTLTGPEATRVQLKAGLRQVAKARRPDPVLIYLNLEVVVADDAAAPDGLRKFLLPYDADLVTLEQLRQRSAGPERERAILAHLERTALSFDWIAETFNQAGLEDHRYLQSNEVLLILDSALPGSRTGLRYAPNAEAAGQALTIGSQFVEQISRVPGRLVVFSGRFKDPLLDAAPKGLGAFVYHFLQGTRSADRVSPQAERNAAGEAVADVVRADDLLDYVRGRIEDESRVLNQPQSLLVLGDNADFPVKRTVR